MTYLFLLGGLFLGWSFGRNNLSNVFGPAIGTRMVSFKWAAALAGLFILLGAMLSSSHTMDSMMVLGTIETAFGAFLVSIAIGLTIVVAGYFGIPVSIVQSSVGAIVGWNLFYHFPNAWHDIGTMVAAWFYCPIIAALFSMALFYVFRWLLKKIRIPLLYRDTWVRILLVLSGVYSAYFLGANNIPAIAGPYLGLDDLSTSGVVFVIGCAIATGALMADKRVIETVSTRLFPLSPMEALVVVLSCGWTLYCFSGNGLQLILNSLSLPSFPLEPIPTSGVLVGSIVGVGLAKGHMGIRWHQLTKIILSWILIPVMSGLICWGILTMLTKGGSVL